VYLLRSARYGASRPLRATRFVTQRHSALLRHASHVMLRGEPRVSEVTPHGAYHALRQNQQRRRVCLRGSLLQRHS
jgi:hypothetical protein